MRIRGSWGGYDAITGHGDFNGDGKVDLLVRAHRLERRLRAGPGAASGKFGRPLGPVAGFGGVTGLSAGASAFGGAAPDVLARSGDSLLLYRNPGTYETGTPIATGVLLPRADTVAERR